MYGLVFTALTVFVAGCGPDCVKSADIQVTVVSNAQVDAGGIARLRVALSVDGGPTKAVDITPTGPLGASAAFLLRPDPAPATKYNVAITVEALASDGRLIGIGSTSGDVVSNGCNRLEARLTSLPGNADGGVDLGGDGGKPADLAGCFGSLPDEDGDGRADFCDLCPADSDNGADGDGDGLPDVCDPDPGRPGNIALYTDLFNGASGQWSGGFSVGNSFLGIVVPNGAEVSANGITQLPADTRIQAHIFVDGFYDPGATVTTSAAGLYLGNSPNPGSSSAAGMTCTLNINQVNLQVEVRLTPITAGAFGTPLATPYNSQITNRSHRVRLTQRGNSYTCEVVSGVNPPIVVTRVGPASVSPQFMALYGQEIDADFHSVFAASALP
jgi:hypothetical protein